MKILFFYPNDYLAIGIHNGIAVLSAVLKKHGHQIGLFDTTFIKTKAQSNLEAADNKIYLPTAYTIEDLVANDPVETVEAAFQKKLDEFQPDLIAVSSMTGHFDWVIGLLRQARHKAKVIVGGVHSTISPEDALKPEVIDLICVGEGEDLMVELCDRIEAAKDYSELKNLGYKKNGQMVINDSRPFVNLDELPTPDWSIFDARHLFRPFMGKIYQGSFYTMSRGCPMQCSYCVNFTLRDKLKNCGRYFRFQSPATTVKQLNELKNNYGATWFKFADDSITYFNDEYLEELAAGLKKLDIMFGCSIRPETATENKIRLIRSMGCVAATIGVESGSPEIRREILNRRMSDDQITEAVKNLRAQGIRVSTFNMIGLPEETRQDVFKTIRFNKTLGTEAVNVYILYPYPGTLISQKYKINFRDSRGKMIPVENASSFNLSKMPPREVEGLLKTFNLYLKLPEAMWPIVELAEGGSAEATRLNKRLTDYAYGV